jgi:hypothetical protein
MHSQMFADGADGVVAGRTTMDASRFNQFAAQNGATDLNMDENLILQFEDKHQRIYWASVYGSNFCKITKGSFFTNQNAYREFCIAVAGMMPKKRTGNDFDGYIRERLLTATIKETLPGMEEGAIVGHAVFSAIARFHKRVCDYDDDERTVNTNVARGDPVFFETRPEGPGYKEMFVRINYMMDSITLLQSLAQFERKINREEVCEWLVLNGRKPYPATGVSPRRLRSTYPIPYSLFLQWRSDDLSDWIDREEVSSEGT